MGVIAIRKDREHDQKFRYFTITSPARTFTRETYAASRLTLSRYNVWRFIHYATRIRKPVTPLKERTIEWLVGKHIEIYGHTHKGLVDDVRVHRADVRSMLARHALWLRAQLKGSRPPMIEDGVWLEWCNVTIPELREDARRHGITFGAMPALRGDPRLHIIEDPDDPTNVKLMKRKRPGEEEEDVDDDAGEHRRPPSKRPRSPPRPRPRMTRGIQRI
ncbi:hypothetical protein EXIGLDRAFT_744117 [Exidia glandulosa HHB12029]|uniref:Uncharacterized protein n=1 Tax=Exidia glandulosa HHB12029 TaxID=1314781 RepID=A0A165Q9J5_EXIGL|nr:hypothetical protein EXIGLDRAFT_744117 [Exidia glandulosa HHB12029]